MSRTWKIALNLLILLSLVALLAISPRWVDWSRLYQLLGEAERWSLLGSVPPFLLGLLLFAWRWHLLLPEEIRLSTLFHISNLGLLANLVVPGRAGEPVRIGLVSGRGRNSVGAVT